jgi:hypothetical protein
MAAGFDWKCTHCGYKVTTSGLHEFYSDAQGFRKPYGHPVPFSGEAAECGIKGFSTMTYCPTCDAVKDTLVMEFDEPIGAVNAWHRAVHVTHAYEDIGGLSECICPECKNKLLETLADIQCPRCHTGVFKLDRTWMS